MTRRLFLLLCIPGALLAAARPGLAAENYVATGDDGLFTVRFPFPFTEMRRTRGTLVGEVKTVIYRSQTPRAIFGVSVTRLPGMALTFAGHGGVMAEARDTILKDYAVEDDKRQYEETTFLGHEARRLTYASAHAPEPVAEVRGQAVFFFVGNTLVTINTAYAAGDAELASAAEAFFRSFKLGLPKL